MGIGRSAFHPGPECFTPTNAVYICADLSVTFSLFACNRAADHTFRLADDPTGRLFAPISATRKGQCERGPAHGSIIHAAGDNRPIRLHDHGPRPALLKWLPDSR